jgi:quinohemoprotein ethanol dehydrogenase
MLVERRLPFAWFVFVALVYLSTVYLHPAVAAEPQSTAATSASPHPAGDVTLSRLLKAESEPGQWLTNGRDSTGSYYSPLKQINTENVAQLGFAWEFKTNTYRGMEATPLFVDGVLYVSGIWGLVYAIDAKSGRALWTFDPHPDPSYARWAGEDIVNHGVAVWNGRVYVVATDCRLFSLDARTGRIDWEVKTLANDVRGYSCPGAPQVAGTVVVVGNAGGENGKGGIRGYVSAFDLVTGQLAWRFYTVPSLAEKHSSPEMVRAATTWDPRRNPEFGGGGTVWDVMAYDPQLDLLYFGTGNAGPYNAPRDWSGSTSGDRLYAATIIALHAKSGRMAWHYQTTPGDAWDYDANANLVLATLNIGGAQRRVLMQANKNGYFYVIDRATGEPLSAAPFVFVNWSSGMDRSFRPIVDRTEGDYNTSPKFVIPSMWGGHNWPPMAFSASTGLVYIPTIETGMFYVDVRKNPGSHLQDVDGATGIMWVFADKSFSYDDWEPIVGPLPRLPSQVEPRLRSILKAWDPVSQKVVWQQQTSQDYLMLDGGALATAGGILVAGREDGRLVVYDAKTGKILKEIDTGTAIMAAPMTYEIDGKQYISVLAGHGGSMYALLGTAGMQYVNEGRLITFELNGAPEVPKPAPQVAKPYRQPPEQMGSASEILKGKYLYNTYCGRCHVLGVPAISPDLSRLEDGIASFEVFNSIVRKGMLLSQGMPRFDDAISESDARALHSYFVDESWTAYRAQEADAPH